MQLRFGFDRDGAGKVVCPSCGGPDLKRLPRKVCECPVCGQLFSRVKKEVEVLT
jgi:ribosomal protein L37AE/L43A